MSVPCNDYAPDTLNPVEEDQHICTGCFWGGLEHTSQTMYALVSDQGTATHETAICNACFTPDNKEVLVKNAPDDVVDRTWHICADNDALECVVCGATVSAAFRNVERKEN